MPYTQQEWRWAGADYSIKKEVEKLGQNSKRVSE